MTRLNDENELQSIRQAGVVFADAVYSLPAFKEALDLKEGALKSMRDAGLKVRYVANRGYVRGEDFNKFIEDQTTTPPGPKAGEKPKHLRNS